jgi:hypothetical protein
MTTVTNTTELLNQSNIENPVYPQEAKNNLHLDNQEVEIEECEFDEVTGKYTITLTNEGIIEVCGVCGEFQAMNDEAMKFYDKGLVDEVDNYEWNNNRCEQKHKPFSIH